MKKFLIASAFIAFSSVSAFSQVTHSYTCDTVLINGKETVKCETKKLVKTSQNSTKSLECKLAVSVYTQRDVYSLSKDNVHDMLISSGFMDNVLSMPAFYQQRIFNIIDTAYSWKYPTFMYTPQSFASSAFDC